jgi:hypothetical protein
MRLKKKCRLAVANVQLEKLKQGLPIVRPAETQDREMLQMIWMTLLTLRSSGLQRCCFPVGSSTTMMGKPWVMEKAGSLEKGDRALPAASCG